MARNARFTLSPEYVTLVATGKVAPAVDWSGEVPPGTPRPQRRHELTGLPLWVVDCLDESNEDANRASVVPVEVASATEPTPAKYRPLDLDEVAVSMYVDKRGHLVVSYTGALKPAGARTAAA